MNNNSERFGAGWEKLMELSSERGQAVIDGFKDIAPDLGRFVVEFAYGDLYQRPELTTPERQLVTIASLTALGSCGPQLDFHIHAGLNVGLKPIEIVEAILHGVPFVGFPCVINAMNVAKRIFAEQGLTVEQPDLEMDADRFERGYAKLMEVDGVGGQNVVKSFEGIAPDLGRLIVEFTFGDVYTREHFDMQKRQLVTLAVLTTLGGCEPQLHVHINAGLNVGLKPEQIVESILHLVAYVGFPRVINAMNVAKHVFAERAVTVK